MHRDTSPLILLEIIRDVYIYRIYFIGHQVDQRNLHNNASGQWLGATVVSGGEDGVIVVSEKTCFLFPLYNA